MSTSPYKTFPPTSFWKKSLTDLTYTNVDPLIENSNPFQFTTTTKIATAGSCFAQNISHYLKKYQCNYYVTEEAAPRLHPEVVKEFNYGTFSARYGNIYNTQQLVQLFDRAYGNFDPIETMWVAGEHEYIDPYRPNIQPEGFYTQLEFTLDRKQHLRFVRELFETLDVFIFTLGLTEYWMHKDDGAVFPLCPGVAGGEFNPEKHLFKNATVTETVADLQLFFTKLKSVNPNAKMILTVSPVPLIATASKNHVLSATTYSKSVLRVAAEEVSNAHEDIAYFPAYEIITGSFNRGRYFAEDLRNVTEEGVQHVMRLFFKHYMHMDIQKPAVAAAPKPNQQAQVDAMISAALQQQCDEVLLET